jgi:hypothetical protein
VDVGYVESKSPPKLGKASELDGHHIQTAMTIAAITAIRGPILSFAAAVSISTPDHAKPSSAPPTVTRVLAILSFLRRD